MTTDVCNETERMRDVLAIGVWENEGGAPGRDAIDEQYGRRVEVDRSWTVYNVFSGVPARVDGQTMTGLSWLIATDGMVSLNRRMQGRHEIRGHLLPRTAIE